MYDNNSELEVERDYLEETNETTLTGTLIKLFAFLIILLSTGGFGIYWLANQLNEPSKNFPVDTPVIIEAGAGVKAISQQLEEADVVQSETLLYFILVTFHDPKEIKASTYIFEEPLKTSEVAKRLTEGDFDSELLRFTHIEGERVTLLAERASEVLPNFDKENFIEEALPYEGKLFPDTYFIPETYNESELLNLMLETFEQKIAGLNRQIENHPLTLDQIITLASIVEREANTPESKKMVAGIFMNRMEISMALQADASIEYVVETPLGKLPEGQLASELRELDSPYNTYKYPGLPPTPIGNPGLDAIEAVLNPTPSDNFYYITGNDGEFYYARTLEWHNRNIKEHLK